MFDESRATKYLRRAGYVSARQIITDLKWTGLALAKCRRCKQFKPEPLRITVCELGQYSVDIHICAECINKISIKKMKTKATEIERLVAHHGSLTKDCLRAWLTCYGMTWDDLGVKLGMSGEGRQSGRTVEGWYYGRYAPPPYAWRALRDLEEHGEVTKKVAGSVK